MNSPKKMLNPQALLSLYGEFPSLSGAEIIEFFLKRDEPRVLMKIMTESKPKDVPARWPEKYDVIYLSLSFIGTREITASGWGQSNIMDRFDF